jgi:macrodomain Ter protein organizer (MatP/YcbG family)
MKFIERLLRLWALSSGDTELITREEYNALMEHLTEQRREMKDMNDRISDWIGTLMKSELLRRELEGKAPQDDLGKSIH